MNEGLPVGNAQYDCTGSISGLPSWRTFRRLTDLQRRQRRQTRRHHHWGPALHRLRRPSTALRNRRRLRLLPNRVGYVRQRQRADPARQGVRQSIRPRRRLAGRRQQRRLQRRRRRCTLRTFRCRLHLPRIAIRSPPSAGSDHFG